MTAVPTASPALASLALATTAAPAAAPVVAPQSPTTATGAATPANQAFSALLLGLRTSGQAGSLVAVPADLSAAQTCAQPPTTTLEAFPITPLAAAPADAEAAGGTVPGGEQLPESGTDLPGADVEALLATVAAPAGLSTPTSEAAPSTSATPLASTTLPASPLPALPGAPTAPASSAQAAHSHAMATQSTIDGTQSMPADAAQAAAFSDNQDSQASDALDTGASDERRGGLAHADAPRGMELGLPAEFRARLDAMLQGVVPRIAPTFDAASSSMPTYSGLGAIGAVTGSGATATPPDTFVDPLLDPLGTLPTLQPLADGADFSQALGERLLLMADKGLQSATIKLQPEHLGPMEIRIDVDDDGSTQVQFSAHHAQTRDALESAIPRLRDLFADQGLSLGQANVDAGRSGFAQRGFAQLSQDLAHDSAGWRGTESEADSPTTTSVCQLGRGSQRRLDILV